MWLSVNSMSLSSYMVWISQRWNPGANRTQSTCTWLGCFLYCFLFAHSILQFWYDSQVVGFSALTHHAGFCEEYQWITCKISSWASSRSFPATCTAHLTACIKTFKEAVWATGEQISTKGWLLSMVARLPFPIGADTPSASIGPDCIPKTWRLIPRLDRSLGDFCY